ncbi:serine hydrolase [bacterium]|nr:serine hydrolase [bacterium]
MKILLILIIITFNMLVTTACDKTRHNGTIKRLDNSLITINKVDSLVNFYMREANVTGLSLSIITNNELAYIKSYGYKNKINHTELTENSIMSGASFSKLVFAYIVSSLAENNLIDLDKPLYKYLDKPIYDFEEFADLKNDSRWKEITARHCLSHSTGFPNSRYFNRDHKLEIFFKPGSNTAYSGEGFSFLQLVIEEITGVSLEELAQKIVFEPLKMTNSSYLSLKNLNEGYASGHNILEDTYGLQFNSNAGAGGSLQTTIIDFSKFILHLMDKNNERLVKRIISPSIRIKKKNQFPSLSFEETDRYNSVNLSYGLGCVVMDTKIGRAFLKEGHGMGFQNYTISFPEVGSSIILMSNSDNAELIFKYLLEDIIKDNFTLWEWEGYIPYDKLSKESIGRYLYDIIVMDSIDNAINTYRKIKESKLKDRFIFDEAELNNLGYQLVKEGKMEDAIKLFIINVEEYPKSANVYDSLAEAYSLIGKIDLAIKYYEKSIELNGNSKSSNTLEKLKVLIRSTK